MQTGGRAVDDKYSVASLTPEEIQSLQADQALRIMGRIDVALAELNKEMFTATAEYFDSKKKLKNLEFIKDNLVERARNLKAIVKNA